MADYWRWRKEEGCVPLWGPYIVVRTMIEMFDYWTNKDLAFPERQRDWTFGFYWGPHRHLQLRYSKTKRIYE